MAVVGKVGTYLNVQPIQGPDFGKMVQDQFDRVDAEKKAKAAAVAKAKEDALKDRKAPAAFNPSGVVGYDESISGLYNKFYNDAAEYKLKYQETADPRYLYEYDKIVNEMDTISNESKALKEYVGNAEELFKSGKINKDNYNEVMNELRQLKDNKAKYVYKDGKAYIQLYDQSGQEKEPQYIGGFVKDQLNLVADIDLNDEFKKIVDRVEAPIIENGNYYRNTKITDINSKEASAQREAIMSAAKGLSGDDAAMTKWYQVNVKPTSGVRKTTGWTDEEREAASMSFYNEMAKSYGKKVERGFGSPNAGSGSDKKDELPKPTLYKLPGSTGQGHAWDASGKNNPTISSLKVTTFGETGKPLSTRVVNSAVLLNVAMVKNKFGKEVMAIEYSEPTGSETQTYTKEDVDKFEEMLSRLTPNTPEYNTTKEDLELAKKSLSGSKKSSRNKLFIRTTDQEVLGNVANSLGLDSTDELLSIYRELAGFNKSKGETLEERKRRLGI
jgi:hypothetical protein